MDGRDSRDDGRTEGGDQRSEVGKKEAKKDRVKGGLWLLEVRGRRQGS